MGDTIGTFIDREDEPISEQECCGVNIPEDSEIERVGVGYLLGNYVNWDGRQMRIAKNMVRSLYPLRELTREHLIWMIGTKMEFMIY